MLVRRGLARVQRASRFPPPAANVRWPPAGNRLGGALGRGGRALLARPTIAAIAAVLAGTAATRAVGLRKDVRQKAADAVINGWNQYHIIARGPVLMQILNGQLMAVAIDEDAKHAAVEGLLGFQMHTGPAFKIQYRNGMLRKLP